MVLFLFGFSGQLVDRRREEAEAKTTVDGPARSTSRLDEAPRQTWTNIIIITRPALARAVLVLILALTQLLVGQTKVELKISLKFCARGGAKGWKQVK